MLLLNINLAVALLLASLRGSPHDLRQNGPPAPTVERQRAAAVKQAKRTEEARKAIEAEAQFGTLDAPSGGRSSAGLPRPVPAAEKIAANTTTPDEGLEKFRSAAPAAGAGGVTFEVRFLEMQPLDREAPGCWMALSSVMPPVGKVLARLSCSAEVGQRCHAEAQAGTLTVALDAVVKVVDGDEVAFQIEPGLTEGTDLWKTYVSARMRSGQWYVVGGLTQHTITASGQETKVRGVAVQVTRVPAGADRGSRREHGGGVK